MESELPDMNDIADVDLYVNDDYKFTFIYPVHVPEAMAALEERIAKTKTLTDDVAGAMGSLVQGIAERLVTENIDAFEEDAQHQISFLLCGFLKHLADTNSDKLEGGARYNFRLTLDGNGMLAEMFDVVTVH